MIDPDRLTDYSRDDRGLEELAVFAVLVQAQRADLAAQVTESLFANSTIGSPFAKIREIVEESSLRRPISWRLVEYGGIRFPNQKGDYLTALAHANLNLATCAPVELTSVRGIGHKTAQLILLHSRPGHRDICPDVHVLRWLRTRHPDKVIPEQAPQDQKTIRRLKNLWLWECDKAGLTPAELDLQVWRAGRV